MNKEEVDMNDLNLVLKERDELKGYTEELLIKNSKLEKAVEVISKERDELKEYAFRLKKYEFGFEPGHFYSPIPSIEEVKKRESKIFTDNETFFLEAGVELNADQQIRLFKEFAEFYKELPFTQDKTEGTRYYYNNSFFNNPDAITLYCMIRYLKPSKIMEVGSGFSSAVTLDVNEKFFNNSIDLTFIEPYPERLYSLLKVTDKVKVIEENLEDVAMDQFCELQKGDILFIDSTHVAKCGSDVNYLFSSIIPALNAGVFIHFHDIMYPFEYPKEWIYEGRSWNEAYVLKAFLQYNNHFKIRLWNSMLIHKYRELLLEVMPQYLNHNEAGSIWIEKCRK